MLVPALLVEKYSLLVSTTTPSGPTRPDARTLTLPPLLVPLDELLEVELLEVEPLDDAPLEVDPLEEEPLEVEPLDADPLDEPPAPVPEEDELVAPPVPWPPLASLYLPKS